jgi:DGQHR domain-containing protein
MAKKKPRKPTEHAGAKKPPVSYTFPIISMQQGKLKMYAFVAPSEVLRSICTVSRRVEDAEKGYQRHLKESRLRQIARYVDEKHGVIPNNIIIDCYDPSVIIDEVKSTITFPGDKKTAWVIDGQHRLFGFEFARTQYPLLVVAFLQLDLKQEVGVFVTINTEQKRLPSSLALDLLGITGNSDEDITTRCRELVAKLNEEEDSPWYGSVNMTGEGVGYIALVNFVRKVKPLVSPNGVLHSYSFQQQCGALANYWSAIKAVYADQWGKSLLTKTLGFGALMNLFPTVFTKTLAMRNGEFTTAAVIATFTLIRDFKFDSDTLGSGSGNKAETDAAKVLSTELEHAIASTIPEGVSGVLKL